MSSSLLLFPQRFSRYVIRPSLDKHLKKAGRHIGWNLMEITIKMKTIVLTPLMIKIIKLRHRNLDNFMPPYLTLSIIRYGSRVKWGNPARGVVPFPTPRCSSYWKGNLQGTLNYSRQLYFLLTLCKNNSRYSCANKLVLTQLKFILLTNYSLTHHIRISI